MTASAEDESLQDRDVGDRRRVEELWNESFSEGIREDAEHYELAKHLNATTHAMVEEFVYDRARAFLPAGGTFLDAGCGSGFFCAELTKLGHESVGIDFNGDLIEIAKKRYPHLDLRQMDIYRCGELARKFDLIVCAGVIQSVFEPEKALAQLASLQDPGGHLSICARARYFVGNALTPLMTRVFLKFQLPFAYYGIGDLVRLGEQAGYRAVEKRYLYMFPGPLRVFNRLFNRSDVLNAVCFPLAVHVTVVLEKHAQ